MLPTVPLLPHGFQALKLNICPVERLGGATNSREQKDHLSIQRPVGLQQSSDGRTVALLALGTTKGNLSFADARTPTEGWRQRPAPSGRLLGVPVPKEGTEH